jgi:UPF0716 protein FxsA
MAVILLFVFIAVPIAEIATFIQVGEKFGLWPTLTIVILTALVGTALLRYQGLRALGRVQESLERGEVPVGEVFTGLCLLIAGALLLTPGFLTDALGFALFVPSIRGFLTGGILRALSERGQVWTNGSNGSDARRPQASQPEETVIDVDFTEVTEDPQIIEIPDKNDGKNK